MTNIGPENLSWFPVALDIRRERMGLDARDEYEAEQQAADDARHARIAADAVDAIVAVNDAAARAAEIERRMVAEHSPLTPSGGATVYPFRSKGIQ